MKYPAYPEYKDSGVEWLGEVPAHWEIWKIAHGYQTTGSGTTPPTENPDWYDGDVCWVTTSELREQIIRDTEKKVSAEALKNFSALKVFPEGSLAIAMYGATIGRLGIFGIDAATNQACCVLSGGRTFETKFVFYWLQAFRDQIIQLATGGGQPNISQEKVRSIRIACPETDEQKIIARFLDAKTAKIDELIAKKRQLIEKLKEKRSALIARTVTQGLPPEVAQAAGLDPHPKMKDSGVEWLGQIPEHWDVPPLYLRYSVELGKMLSESKITGANLVPYLRNVDVQWGRINYEDLPEMDIGPDEQMRYTIRPGDLLVCEGGEVGRAAIVGDVDGVIGYQKALHRLRPSNRTDDPRFLFFVFKWAAHTGVFNSAGTSTIAHLTGEQLRRYRFPRPPSHEQQQIAHYLEVESERITHLSFKIESAISCLNEYRQALITTAVTGKIDVREAA